MKFKNSEGVVKITKTYKSKFRNIEYLFKSIFDVECKRFYLYIVYINEKKSHKILDISEKKFNKILETSGKYNPSSFQDIIDDYGTYNEERLSYLINYVMNNSNKYNIKDIYVFLYKHRIKIKSDISEDSLPTLEL